jgi:hypothetical protein|tara:strand:- start:209 stop:403 length:195 start_codon:yes stop_codon:yes gene_type:complete
MYLILKHVKYNSNLDDNFYIVGSAKDIKNANRLLNAHNTINEKEYISYSILNYEPPLILKNEVA